MAVFPTLRPVPAGVNNGGAGSAMVGEIDMASATAGPACLDVPKSAGDVSECSLCGVEGHFSNESSESTLMISRAGLMAGIVTAAVDTTGPAWLWVILAG